KVRDSLNLMLRAYETAPVDDPLRPSYRRLMGRQGQKLERILRHNYSVNAVAFSPDGRTVLTGSVAEVRLWDAASGKEVAALPHHGYVSAVAYSPDGRTALTGGSGKTVRLWHAASGKEVAALPHGAPVLAAAFSPDGRTVLTGTYDPLSA